MGHERLSSFVLISIEYNLSHPDRVDIENFLRILNYTAIRAVKFCFRLRVLLIYRITNLHCLLNYC